MLATAVLVVGGLYVLSIFDSRVDFGLGGGGGTASNTPSGTPTPVITPVTDPASVASRNITITVLNGTDVVGLQNQAAAKLTAKGWSVGTTANSTETTIKTTTVYYSDAANQDVAEGIQLLLGAQDVQFSNAFPGVADHGGRRQGLLGLAPGAAAAKSRLSTPRVSGMFNPFARMS
ncbi:MAG: LytR C-terminal domain-containing protein [Galbitalea sp.]